MREKKFAVSLLGAKVKVRLQQGKLVDKLIVERVGKRYRLLLLVKGLSEPISVTLARGGERFWGKFETLVSFIDANLSHCKVIEMHLQPLRDSSS